MGRCQSRQALLARKITCSRRIRKQQSVYWVYVYVFFACVAIPTATSIGFGNTPLFVALWWLNSDPATSKARERHVQHFSDEEDSLQVAMFIGGDIGIAFFRIVFSFLNLVWKSTCSGSVGLSGHILLYWYIVDAI